MPDGSVQLAPDSTGKKVDTSELTVNSQTVERQRIVLADPINPLGLGTVKNSIADGSEYTPVVRAIASATDFVVSSNNSTTAQLAAGNTFTGAIETIFAQQDISILLTSDQPGTLTLKQYIDAGGARIVSSWPFTIAAGVPFSRSFVGNGNYFNLTFQNTGGGSTTTLNINTAYGTLTPATNLGNLPVALNEVGGVALALGQATMANSFPVVFPSNQTALPLSTNAAQETGGNLATLVTRTPSLGQGLSAASSPVTLASDQAQDGFVIGQSGQSTLGNNAFLATAGAGSTDTVASNGASWRSFFCQVIGSSGIAGGQIIFEGSNDNTTFTPLTVYDDAAATGTPIIAATAIAASTNRFFSGKVTYRYIRCRISTAFTGGTIQAITRLSTSDYMPRVVTVGNPTAANLTGTMTLSANTPTLAAGTNLAADVGIQYRANATGAATPSSILSPATPAGASIKGSAGRVLGYHFQNSSAGVRSIKFFNQTAVTMGTTAAVFEIDIPAGGSAFLDLAGGIGFSTGIMWAVTAAKGLTDNTATGLAANDVSGVVFYA